MQEMTEQQLKLLKHAEEGAWSRSRAYIIMHPDYTKDSVQKYGKIKVSYPSDGAGTLHVWVWDTEGFAGHGTAKGGGYDKLSAALAKIPYDGIKLGQGDSMEWENNLRKRGYTVIQAI